MTVHRTVVVQGAKQIEDVPGIEQIGDAFELRFSNSTRQLERALPDAEILLSWDLRPAGLRENWHRAERLRWIHWGGAGVDAVLFPELVTSDVVLTNSQGIFDRAMAEYVLVRSPCPPDLNGDGMVGVPDLLALLAAWGTNPGGPPDFDGDGVVAVPDLLTLLAAWGPCE